jgi:hypothetical protein
VREQTYLPGQLAHPELMPNGSLVWVDGDSVGELVDRLQRGSPAHGWEGDPRLVVTYHAGHDQWEVWRYEADGQYRLVAPLGPPGCPIDVERAIVGLMEMDRRRGFDAGAHLVAHNDANDERRVAERAEEVAEGVRKLGWVMDRADML